MHSLLVALALVPLALSLPQFHILARQNEGPGLHTLTAYAPNNTLYDGLKVEYSGNLNLFQAETGSYCPGPPNVPNCPNGTDTVFAGTFYPVRLQTSAIPTFKHRKHLRVLIIDCMI
jgi:hypothetical protein